MKIAVLVKQVPGSESSLPINESNDWIDESSITYVMNPPDNFALEEALIIKEKIGSGEVVVVSMGPSRVQKVIREGLSKGADRGIHIQEDEIIEIDRPNNRVKIKGLNLVKKHMKTTKEKKGGIITKENFINISNLMVLENAKKTSKEKKVKA